MDFFFKLIKRFKPDDKSEAFGALMGIAEKAEEVAPLEQKEELHEFNQRLAVEYSSGISLEQGRNEMAQLAQDYKKLREVMPPGSRRTISMESIAKRMRALAPKVALSPETIKVYLESQFEEEQGNRLIGVSIMESTGDVDYFEQVLQIVDGNSFSAFEQYHALRAIEKMLPQLSSIQKERLRKALNKQREYDPDKHQWIKYKSDRWWLSERLLSKID
jgi:hypothetical protein